MFEKSLVQYLFFTFILENNDNGTNDVFENKFTSLDKQLTEVSAELASTMSILLHLRHTFHRILQSRRAILFDIILHLSDKAKIQVKITDKRIDNNRISITFF